TPAATDAGARGFRRTRPRWGTWPARAPWAGLRVPPPESACLHRGAAALAEPPVRSPGLGGPDVVVSRAPAVGRRPSRLPRRRRGCGGAPARGGPAQGLRGAAPGARGAGRGLGPGDRLGGRTGAGAAAAAALAGDLRAVTRQRDVRAAAQSV